MAQTKTLRDKVRNTQQEHVGFQFAVDDGVVLCCGWCRARQLSEWLRRQSSRLELDAIQLGEAQPVMVEVNALVVTDVLVDWM